MRRVLLSAAVLLCAGSSLFGVTLLVGTAGQYTASVPTTAWTAPNATWNISFNVDSNPTVLSSSAGSYTHVPVTNLVYTLNGSAVSVAAVDVTFYSAASFGLMDIGFFGSSSTSTPTNGFLIEGSQAYTGPEATPTFLRNTYPQTLNEVLVAGTAFTQPNGIVAISGPLVATPVPSSLILLLVGLAMGTAFLMSQRFARG